MILRFHSIDCPACASPTLEWSNEVSGSACETCGYAGNRDDADREPAGLALLRRWRAELAFPIQGSIFDPAKRTESAVLFRRYRLENCAALADMYRVPRMGSEEECPAMVAACPPPDWIQEAGGGAVHMGWKVQA